MDNCFVCKQPFKKGESTTRSSDGRLHMTCMPLHLGGGTAPTATVHELQVRAQDMGVKYGRGEIDNNREPGNCPRCGWSDCNHAERIEADKAETEKAVEEARSFQSFTCRCGCGCKRPHTNATGSYCYLCENGDCPEPCIECRKVTNLSDSGRCGNCERNYQAEVD